MERIDMHCHLLPGIDDGARDEAVSMEMFRIAAKNGITSMILTPHYKPMHNNASPATVQRLVREARERLRSEDIPIELYTGNEIYYHEEAVEALLAGDLCTLADSHYVLVEFGPMDEFSYIRNGLYRFLVEGYRPILAHVERYRCMTEDIARTYELIRLGSAIQVNAGSIMGKTGMHIKSFTRKLLKKELVDFIATDAHDTAKRAPDIGECALYLEKKFGQDYAKRVLQDNPDAILIDTYL